MRFKLVCTATALTLITSTNVFSAPSYNTVFISNDLADAVYGGKSDQSLIIGNKVVIDGGRQQGSVYGGLSISGSVVGNVLEISGGTQDNLTVGGYSFSGDVVNNKVIITGGIQDFVRGGAANTTGSAIGNEVEIKQGIQNYNTIGGYSGQKDAIGNKVTISGGNQLGSITGGFSTSKSGLVSGNRVKISGGVQNGDILGGRSSDNSVDNILGLVTGNLVEISGGIQSGFIYGGFSDLASVTDNKVRISGGNQEHVRGGYSEKGFVSNNEVHIASGIQKSVLGGWAAQGDSVNNKVIISGGEQSGNIAGGNGLRGLVRGNTVEISGGIQSANIYGGMSNSAAADQISVTGNTVIISGGLQKGIIWGGVSSGASVSFNTVVINGGLQLGDVIGGKSETAGNAFGNKVVLGSNTSIGGYVAGGSLGLVGGVSYDNTLILNGSGVKVGSVRAGTFQNFNFNIDPAAINSVMLTSGAAVDMTGIAVAVSSTGHSNLSVGDRVTLINNVTNAQNQSFSFSHGLSMHYQGHTLVADAPSAAKSQGNNALEFVIESQSLNPQTKSASEGRIAGLAMVNHGVDMAASMTQSLGNSMNADGLQGFINTGGSSARYKSGSHVDLDATSLIAGIATRTEFGVLGGFFETGEGNYASVNSFNNAPSVKGSGHTRYTGVGVLGRYDISNNLHLDGTLSVGRARLNYSSKNWCDNQGQCADYSNSVAYKSGSLTLGYVMPVTGDTSVNLRSGMQWTHINGASAQIGNDPYTFAGTDSKRWINGVRVSHDLLDNLAVYGGLAYEYEFDGKAEGSVRGMKLDTPTLKGSTTIAEAGIRASHKIDNDVLTLDFGLQGFDGQRSGFGGQLRVGYAY